MTNSLLLVLSVIIPVLGAFFLPAINKISSKARNFFALVLVAFPFGIALRLLGPVLAGEKIHFFIQYPFNFNLSFTADVVAVGMALVSSFISLIILIYSWSYIKDYEHQNEYFLIVVLFLGSMMGLVYAGNLLLIYLFWELTALACWRLIGFFRSKESVERADKAFIFTVCGALIMLTGFIMLYANTGSFELADIRQSYLGKVLPDLAVLLILCGILSKSATLPLHSWLPDAGVAPSPVTALLHAAVLVKIGLYVYVRIFILTAPVSEFWFTAVPVLAGFSALISGSAALVEKDIKRIIAYSTISQISFILLGISLGSQIGLVGGLLYILMHSLAKAGLFLCAGIVEKKMHTKDITRLGGLASAMPLTALAFLVCSFSLMGVPPLGGFFSKFFVLSGAAESGNWLILGLFIASAIMTILYLCRVFMKVFMGEVKTALVREGSPVMVAGVLALAVLSLISGILIQFPYAMVTALYM
jgi:proton-translocating NADH-quinone oxidoreductase chain N